MQITFCTPLPPEQKYSLYTTPICARKNILCTLLPSVPKTILCTLFPPVQSIFSVHYSHPTYTHKKNLCTPLPSKQKLLCTTLPSVQQQQICTLLPSVKKKIAAFAVVSDGRCQGYTTPTSVQTWPVHRWRWRLHGCCHIMIDYVIKRTVPTWKQCFRSGEEVYLEVYFFYPTSQTATNFPG